MYSRSENGIIGEMRRFPASNENTDNWYIVEHGIKHHNPNPLHSFISK
jgi:hypothetical protein